MEYELVRVRSRGAGRCTGIKRAFRTLLLMVMAWSLPHTAIAAGPDTTARSFIKLEHRQTLHYPTGDVAMSYARPTAAAASIWALVGNSNLSYEAWVVGACCTSFIYTSNPVVATGPFNGMPYATQNILPPPLANPDAAERFGASLAIHGNRIAVGSTEVLAETLIPPFNYVVWVPIQGGQVHLYQHDGTSFVYERTVAYGVAGAKFGYAVDLRANALLVGRPGATIAAADLFDPDSGSLITTFTSPASDDAFGETVALLDDLALVGASGSGTVYAYRHDGAGNWNAAGTLTSPGASSEFGAAIDVDNGRILVGAPGIDRAYIFEDDGDADWPVVAEIAGGAGSRLGHSVALTGDTAFLGAPQVLFAGGNRFGLVVRHERATDGTWPYVAAKASRRPTNGDGFGTLVAASSSLLSVVEKNISYRPSEFYIFSTQESIWDSDSDGISDYGDNCAELYNPDQADFERDDIGDDCDPDIDNDGLLNTEEDNIGSDPYNADTDGDGLGDAEDPYPLSADGDGDGITDFVDNCPMIDNPGQGDVDGDADGDACDANIDGDILSNDEEAILGTDPYNPDTDGDLHRDGEDFLPLDSADGWAKKYQFQASAEQVRLGTDVLLVLEDDKRTLRSFANQNGAWTEVPAPVIPGAPVLELYGGGVAGNRFVTLLQAPATSMKRSFYQLDWSAANGWVRSALVDYSWLSLNMTNAVVGQNRIVIEVYAGGYTDSVFEITPSGPQLIESTTQIENHSSASRGIVGNHLFSLRPLDDHITAYDLLNGYSSQLITWPDSTQGDRLGDGFYPVGADKVLVDATNNSFWMSLENGVWNLELTGISKWSTYSDHISGGDGSVLVHDLDPATQGGFDLYRVHRVSDGSEVGKFNEWKPGYSRILTNGRVVVQARRGATATAVVDIFEVPPVGPPGC